MTPTYRWFRNGSLLTGRTSDTLSFSPLEETDSGVYICEGTRSSVTATSASVSITVIGKPAWIYGLGNSYIILFVTATISFMILFRSSEYPTSDHTHCHCYSYSYR